MPLCKDDMPLLGFCLIGVELYLDCTVYICVASWSHPLSVLLFSNEQQKADRHSARSAKQAFSTVMVFKVFSLDVAHDGRHAVCTECLCVCSSALPCSPNDMKKMEHNILFFCVERKLQCFCLFVCVCVCVCCVCVIHMLLSVCRWLHDSSGVQMSHCRALPTGHSVINGPCGSIWTPVLSCLCVLLHL